MIVTVYSRASMYPPSYRDINDYDVTLKDEKDIYYLLTS